MLKGVIEKEPKPNLDKHMPKISGTAPKEAGGVSYGTRKQ